MNATHDVYLLNPDGTPVRCPSNDLNCTVLALESIIRWTNRDDLEPADLLDAIHSVARVALESIR